MHIVGANQWKFSWVSACYLLGTNVRANVCEFQADKADK